MLSYIYNVFHSIFIHAMDELFMSEIKKTVSNRLVSFKQLQMSSVLCQIRIFSNFYQRSFSIGIKMISKIDFSKLITNTRKATLLYVQFGFTMINDLSALLTLILFFSYWVLQWSTIISCLFSRIFVYGLMNGHIARFFIEFLELDWFLSCNDILFYGTARPFFGGNRLCWISPFITHLQT